MAIDSQTLAALLSGGGGNSQVNTGNADLNAFGKTLEQNDIYNIAAAPVYGAKFDTSTWKPGTTAAVTAGQAFLGTLLHQLGQQDVAQQLSKVADIAPQLYANPAAATRPDGVDESAFRGLQLASMAKKQTNDAEIARSLATQYGGKYDPVTGEVTPIPGAQDLMSGLFTKKAEAAAAAKAGNATGSRASVSVAKDLSGTLAAIDALNRFDNRVSDFPGGDSVIGGLINSAATLIPGTTPYQYQKDLPLLNDPLTVGLSGSSKQGTLAQMKAAMSQGVGTPESSMHETYAEAKRAMSDKAQKYLETLAQAGWPEENAPPGLPSLSELRQKYAAASAGQVDVPAQAASYSDITPAQAREEIARRAALKSQGGSW